MALSFWGGWTARRWRGHIHWIGFCALVVFSTGLLAFVSPALMRLDPILERKRGVVEASHFASAVLGWAALGVAVLISLLVVYGVSFFVLSETTPSLRHARVRSPRVLLAVSTASALIVGMVSVFSGQSDLTELRDPSGASLLLLPIEWVTALANGMTFGAVMMLFAAASRVMLLAVLFPARRTTTCRERFLWLRNRLKLLLWVGAIATAFGTIEIGAVHRLAASTLANADQAQIDAIGVVSTSIAQFWGMVFTLALGVLYLPASIVIGWRMPDAPPTPAAARAIVPDPSDWEKRLKEAISPFLGLFTALAPLIVGQLSEVILKLISEG